MGPSTSFSKPGAAMVTLYRPFGVETVSYRPSLFVVKTFCAPVSTFKTETDALGITAPVESLIVPRISPVAVLCALATAPQHSRRQRANNPLFRLPNMLDCLRRIKPVFLSVLSLLSWSTFSRPTQYRFPPVQGRP